MKQDKKRGGIIFLKLIFSLIIISIISSILIVFLLDKKEKTSVFNITNPAPNIIVNNEQKTEAQPYKEKDNTDNVQNLINTFGPRKTAPRHTIYSPEETKNFKEEILFLSAEIEEWIKFSLNKLNNNSNAILYGDPMTGKTSTVRQLARQAGIPLVSVKGSDLAYYGYEQRSILEKFETLLKELDNNPVIRASKGRYILLVDEADQIGDGLSCLKELLGDVNDNKNSKNLWIFITNYINKIDKAVFENRQRMKFKLDFSWNKNIFVNHALQNQSLKELLNLIIPFDYSKEKKQIAKKDTLGEIIKSTSTEFDNIYNRFNFENLKLLAKHQADFIGYFRQLIDFKEFESIHVPILNFHEWKQAINNEINSQVSLLEIVKNSSENLIELDEGQIVPLDTLLSLVFEYTLDLFWKAKDKNRFGARWGNVNPSNFIRWAQARGYSLEELGLTIFKSEDKPCYVAKFIPKIFPKAA